MIVALDGLRGGDGEADVRLEVVAELLDEPDHAGQPGLRAVRLADPGQTGYRRRHHVRLAGMAAVHGGPGHAGPRRNRLHRAAVVALLREQRETRVDDGRI